MLDEKGRIFGKVNIVDFAVVLLAVLVIGAVSYKFVFNRAAVSTSDSSVYVTVVCRLAPKAAAEALQPGDKMVAKNAFQDAEVVKVEYDQADFVAWTAEGKPSWEKHPIWVDVRVTLKDKGAKYNPIVKIGGQEARIGNKYIVKTQTVELQGVVDDIVFE